MGLLDTQQGEICRVCSDARRNGVMIIKQGKHGKFLGCSKFPYCTYTTSLGQNLEAEATKLLKVKRKKIRRGRRKLNKEELATVFEAYKHRERFKSIVR